MSKNTICPGLASFQCEHFYFIHSKTVLESIPLICRRCFNYIDIHQLSPLHLSQQQSSKACWRRSLVQTRYIYCFIVIPNEYFICCSFYLLDDWASHATSLTQQRWTTHHMNLRAHGRMVKKFLKKSDWRYWPFNTVIPPCWNNCSTRVRYVASWIIFQATLGRHQHKCALRDAWYMHIGIHNIPIRYLKVIQMRGNNPLNSNCFVFCSWVSNKEVTQLVKSRIWQPMYNLSRKKLFIANMLNYNVDPLAANSSWSGPFK